MKLSSVYNRLARVSPYVEIMLRKIYWRNVNRLGKYNPHKVQKPSQNLVGNVDFGLILDWLKKMGIGPGDILIVHSGYGELEKTGLSPDEIIDRLLDLIGPDGTLVMPVIRRFKDLEKAKKEGRDLTSTSFKYKVSKSLIISGMLPYTLMQREGAVVSHHPFNPLCALGPHARKMMKNNIDGDFPSPHGPNSCWKYCYDHGAKVCSIGIDIEHHNTMLHIAEEAFGDWRWNEDEWYEHIKFEIIDENNSSKEIVVSNRKDDWGKLHIASINLCEAEKKEGILVSDKIKGVTVGFVDVSRLIPFLRSRNKNGYPYFVFPWEKINRFK